MLTGKDHALHRTFPQAPVFTDLPWAVGQVGTTHASVRAVSLDLITGESTTGLGVERMQTDQHLVDHLLFTKGLQQASVIAGQVDHHVGPPLERRLDPQHAEACVTVDFARHACTAFPNGFLELEHDLVAPTIVGTLERRQVLAVQARGHLNLGQCAQGHGHDQIIRLVAEAADFYRDTILVLDNGGNRRVGLDGFQLLDESLGQHRAATGQARSAQVAVADAAVDAVLLGEVQQRQAGRFIVAGADLLIDQLTGGGRQLQFVQPGGDVDLVKGEQRAGCLRVQRVIDRTGQVIEGFLITLERLGSGRLLGGQVAGAEVLAVDQVTRGSHELGRRQCFKLETVEVLVEHRLCLGVADPLAGGQARTPAHARLGLQQGHLPAFVLQLVGCRQACQATPHDNRRGRLVFCQRSAAGHTNQYQRAQAHPSSSHVGELRVRGYRNGERQECPRKMR